MNNYKEMIKLSYRLEQDIIELALLKEMIDRDISMVEFQISGEKAKYKGDFQEVYNNIKREMI